MMGRPPVDLINQIFGRLTVIEKTDERKNNYVVWLCKCSCNKTVKATTGHLQSGNVQSCGCLQVDRTRETHLKHGACQTKYKEGNTQLDYSLWKGMKSRCYTKSNASYKNYSERGIKVCKKWRLNFQAFAKYIRTLPNCPKEKVLLSRSFGKRLKVSLDRINNDKNYEEGNLKWSTHKEQQNNTSKNRIVTYKNTQMTLSQAVEKYGVVSYNTVSLRLNTYNWSLEDALTTPYKRNY